MATEPAPGDPNAEEAPGTPPDIPENVNVTTGTPVVLTDDEGNPLPTETTSSEQSDEPVIKQPDTPGGPYTQVDPPQESVFTQNP